MTEVVLTGPKRMLGSLHCFTDRGGIGRVVLAAPAAHSVRRHELRGHQLDGVAVGRKQASPVMEPEQGSMPMVHAGKAATNSLSLARATLG